MDEQGEADENLRTVGHRPVGRLKLGRPVKAPSGSVPFSSIPVKFEATTLEHRSEKKAFGSQKPRFTSQTHTLPGPGAYFRPGSLLRETDSISKKGYGSLTSSDKRWRHQKTVWTGPGPGDYRHWDARSDKAAACFNKASTTANFHHVKDHLERMNMGAAEPGPGSYNHMAAHHDGTEVKWIDTPHAGQASAFKATARQMMLAGNKEAPGAGRYNLGKDWTVHESQFSQFKNHSKREMESKAEDTLPAVIFGDTAAPTRSGAVPGPGTYNMQESQSITRKVSSFPGKMSAAFARGVTDRFGQPLRARACASDSPGPGNYEAPHGSFAEKEGMASSFVSTVRFQRLQV